MANIKALQTGHVGLNVTDLDRSVAFYKAVFEFEVVAEGKEDDRRFAFLGRDGKLLVTLWQQSEETSPPAVPGCTTCPSRWRPSTR